MNDKHVAESDVVVQDLASPASIMEAMERLVFTLPSGWTVTELTLTKVGNVSSSLVMRSEPRLLPHAYKLEREAREAHRLADKAAADARTADLWAASARANYEAHLDDSRPYDEHPKTASFAGFELDRRVVSVND